MRWRRDQLTQAQESRHAAPTVERDESIQSHI